jgi:hypothetical protein
LRAVSHWSEYPNPDYDVDVWFAQNRVACELPMEMWNSSTLAIMRLAMRIQWVLAAVLLPFIFLLLVAATYSF